MQVGLPVCHLFIHRLWKKQTKPIKLCLELSTFKSEARLKALFQINYANFKTSKIELLYKWYSAPVTTKLESYWALRRFYITACRVWQSQSVFFTSNIVIFVKTNVTMHRAYTHLSSRTQGNSLSERAPSAVWRERWEKKTQTVWRGLNETQNMF